MARWLTAQAKQQVSEVLRQSLPAGVVPAYDGMKLTLETRP